MRTTLNNQKNNAFLTFGSKYQIGNQDRYNVPSMLLCSLLLVMYMFYILTYIEADPAFILTSIPGLLVVQLLFIFHKRMKWIVIGSILLSWIVSFFVLHTYMISGVIIYLNRLYEVIGNNTGVVFFPYQAEIVQSKYDFALLLFLSYVSVLLAFLVYYMIVKARAFLLWTFLAILFITGAVIELERSLILDSAAVGLAVLMSFAFLYRNTSVSGGKKAIRHAVLYGSVVFVLISALFLSLYPTSGLERKMQDNVIKEKASKAMETFRYKLNDVDSLTEGDFTSLGKRKTSGQTALEVTMDEPDSMYLRGYIGEKYTSEKWEPLSSDINYENKNLFYWLDKTAFHPLNQWNKVNELIDDSVALPETEVTIHNTGANRKYLYTPYGLTTDIDDFESIKTDAKQTIKSSKLFGEDLYQMQTQQKTIPRYPTLANNLYEKLDNGKLEEYKENEHHYNAFIYEAYTKLPEQVEHILENHFTKETTEISYEQAIDEVQSFLTNTIQYQLEPDSLPRDQDFLLHVLEDSQEGYDVHYATIAALLFRYMDIPARYVEGYLITPDDVEGKSNYETINVPGKNAHAWPEIYIDQLGWIPVEVTPPFEETMEQIDTSDYPSGKEHNNREQDSKTEQNETTGTDKVKEKEDKNVLTPAEEEQNTSWHIYFIYIGLSILLILILFTIYRWLKKYFKLKNIKQSFQTENLNHAVENMFAYSLFLLHQDDIPRLKGSVYEYEAYLLEAYDETYAELFKQAAYINQVAKYSSYAVSKKDKNIMDIHLESTVDNILKNKNKWKQLLFRYWQWHY